MLMPLILTTIVNKLVTGRATVHYQCYCSGRQTVLKGEVNENVSSSRFKVIIYS